MRIFLYCQHVLGIGHFFRTLEICKALDKHDVVLVSGGPVVDTPLPDHVQELRLPGLIMDPEFKRLLPAETDESLEKIKRDREKILGDYFNRRHPDVFLIELYPFGRKAFRFELDPILEKIRSHAMPGCRVICSLRDILVEKTDQNKYESRVLKILNTYFNALLVHADPAVVKLDETFSRMQDIDIPVVYTGFVTRKPVPGARLKLRKRLGVGANDALVVASAGGGKVGAPLLKAVVRAFDLLRTDRKSYLYLFTGPMLDSKDYQRILHHASDRIIISRFTTDFLSYLAAADLSVSMAGYNTCMNILASGVPSLVWPFSQNREQRLRAERLEHLGAMSVLGKDDLDPPRLAERMEKILAEPPKAPVPIDLDGARQTANWIRRV
jgi:predicted glycosyltransferase